MRRSTTAIAGPFGVDSRGDETDAEQRALWLLAAIVALGALLRLFAIGSESLWYDEGFTWWWSQQRLADLWGANGRIEATPPLYYTFQHLWFILGQSEVALRSLPALFGTATIPLGYLIGRIVGDRGVGLMTALLLATSALHVYFSQEARAYTLLGAVTMLAVLGLLRYLRANDQIGGDPPSARVVPSGLVLYAFGTTVALYTLYSSDPSSSRQSCRSLLVVGARPPERTLPIGLACRQPGTFSTLACLPASGARAVQRPLRARLDDAAHGPGCPS
jgi:hypothetical protein